MEETTKNQIDERFVIFNPKRKSNAYKEMKRIFQKEVNIIDEFNLNEGKEKQKKPIMTSLKDLCSTDDKLIKTKYELKKPNEEILQKAFNLLD